MTGYLEHSDRRNRHRQPRPTSHWGTDDQPHPGPVRDDCPMCREVGT